jgi:hypothetical protein
MQFNLFKKDSKIKWWEYLLVGIFLFIIGYYTLDGDIGMAVITIGWGPIIVGTVKLFKENRNVIPFLALTFLISGTFLYFYFNLDNNILSNPTNNNQYILNVPNLNFEIAFPEEPKFNRTDSNGFVRYTWSYIDSENSNSLFVQAQNNFYIYNKSKESFIEEVARLYNGMVSSLQKTPDEQSIEYQIIGVGSASNQSKTIIGKIIDVGEYTFVITNTFEETNNYPNFTQSFKVTN